MSNGVSESFKDQPLMAEGLSPKPANYPHKVWNPTTKKYEDTGLTLYDYQVALVFMVKEWLSKRGPLV